MHSASPSSTKDVVVVGGGPAGSTAARRLALARRRVLLLERARFPRYKSCGGAVTERVKSLLDFDIAPAVERIIHRVVFSYRGRAHRPIKVSGDPALSMVMRSTFDALLLRKAQEAGVKVLEGERVVDLAPSLDGVAVRTHTGASFIGRVCIGADGAASRVARLTGLAPPEPVGVGLSAEIRMPEERLGSLDEPVQLDFGGVLSGYRWVFPKATQYSIGACTTDADRNNLKERLNNYIATGRNLRGCGILKFKTHPLPFYRAGRRLQSGRVLLVGDAAGLVDPLTGEGILHAIQSASIAAQCVEGFLRGKAPLDAYTNRLSEEILHDFNYAARFAEIFFHRPWVSYLAGITSRTANQVLINVLMGRGTYEEAYHTLRATLAGRLRCWIVPPLLKKRVYRSP